MRTMVDAKRIFHSLTRDAARGMVKKGLANVICALSFDMDQKIATSQIKNIPIRHREQKKNGSYGCGKK